MASSGGTTLRFSVEVSSDQATESLRAITQALNEVGVKSKGAFLAVASSAKPANDAVGGFSESLRKLKTEQTQQGRQARFLANEIASIIPVSSGASAGLQGMFSAVIELSGGITRIAAGMAVFELAKVAIQLVGEETKISAERTKSFAEAQKIYADSIKRSWEGLIESSSDMSEGQKAYNAALRESQSALDALRAKYLETAKAGVGTLSSIKEFFGLSTSADEYSTALGKILALERSLQESAQNRATFARQIAEATAKEAEEKKRLDAVERARTKAMSDFQVESDSPTARSFMPENPFAGIDDTKKVTDPFAGYQKGATDAYVATIKLGYANQKMAEQSAQDWAATGQAYGSIFGAMATGQMTVMQGMAAMGQQMVAMITQLAVQSITASASKAGAEAAASQAGIPIIGPALAIGAMGAMVSAVLGLLANVHSASGGFDVGNFAPVTQLHPREMVLPAPLADRVRSMTGSGGDTYNVQFTTLDPVSLEQYLKRNPGVLVRALSYASKNRST